MNRRREILKYRWEFMRRSREYWKAWRRAMKLRETVRPLWDNPRIEVSDWKLTYRATPQYQEELKIADTFGLTWMYDPALTFEAIAGEDIFRVSLPESRSYYADEMDSQALRTRMKTPERFTIEIDFSEVNSIEALKEELCFRLAAHWALYCKHSHGKEKANLRDFDRIIMAGDLKRKGFSQRKIAAKIFPGTENIEDERTKVKKDLEHYQDFTSGGWRKLAYP